MILTARRSLVQKMARHQQPQIEIFFLNITVRRFLLILSTTTDFHYSEAKSAAIPVPNSDGQPLIIK